MGQAHSLHNTGLSIPYSHSYHNVNIPTADIQHAKRVFAPRSSLQPRQPEYRTEVDWTTLRLYGEEDRLPDFSYAGAWASSRELPSPRRSASITLDPTGDNTDRTKEIQAAINKLARGGGGVLELSKGTYYLSGDTIDIWGNNVTVRGEYDSDLLNKAPTTVLIVNGTRRDVFTIGNPALKAAEMDSIANSTIRDAHVPVGAESIMVFNASLFQVKQEVYVTRVVTPEWIADVGMDDLVREGEDQVWLAPGTLYHQPRRIVAINQTSNTLSFDFPLTDSLTRPNNTGYVVAYKPPANRTSGSGVENFSIRLFEDQSDLAINDRTRFGYVFKFGTFSQDNWVRNLDLGGFLQFIHVETWGKRITIQDVVMRRDKETNTTAGLPADILIDGSQVLVHRCTTTGVPNSRTFTAATGALVSGPNVMLLHSTTLPEHVIQPHARWATGILVDSSDVGIVELYNRGTKGSGHGWACANSVAWNIRTTGRIDVQSPPGSANLCVGCVGNINSDATPLSFFSPQIPVNPPSLFERQLIDRIGQELAFKIVYPPTPGSLLPLAGNSSGVVVTNTTAAGGTGGQIRLSDGFHSQTISRTLLFISVLALLMAMLNEP